MNRTIQEFYTANARSYEMFSMRIFRYNEAIRTFFSGTSYLHPHMKIMDAGCGSGLVIRTLKKISEERNICDITFHGFDITNAMLELFRKRIDRSDSNLEVLQADAMQLQSSLPAHWNEYDLIISSAMLEYIPKEKLVGVLASLRALLRSNGRILIFISRENLLMKWLIQKRWRANMYTRDEVQAVFSGAGFKGVTFKKFGFPYQYLNSWGFIVEAKN